VRRPRASILAALLALTTIAAAQSTPKRAAVVNGEVITEDQVTKAAAAELQKLDSQRAGHEATYARDRLQILHSALESLAEDKLIAVDATKQGLTKARLIEIEIESNVETPSDEEVAAFYEANKARIPMARAEALPQVKQYLIDQSRGQYRNMLVGRLKKQYGYKVYLDPLRTDVETAGHPSVGPANAPVTIVEFADFECPHCGAMFPTLKAIENAYAGKLRVVYRQFPIASIHPHALKASEASLCANEQQHFWEYHDSLFRAQDQLEIESLKKRAADLKLDTAAFNRCLDSGKQAAAVKKDIDDGGRAGVTGTPALFINGRMLSGSQPYADIREIVDDELQRQGGSK
jgi:protein-disulfide isomerase